MFAQAKAFAMSAVGIVILALILALIVQTVRIEGFKIWPLSVKGLKAELSDCRNREKGHKDLADQSKRQQERTKTVIKEGEARIVYVDRQVGKLESQPLQGNCQTPNANE